MRRPTVNTVYTLWSEMDEELREQNQQRLSHLLGLASTAGVDIRRWNLVPFMEEGNHMKPVNEINVTFFERYEAAAQRASEAASVETPAEVEGLPALLNTGFQRAMAARLQNHRDRIQQRLEQEERHLTSLRHQVAAQERVVLELLRRQDELSVAANTSDYPERIVADAQALLAEGWYSDLVVIETSSDQDDPRTVAILGFRTPRIYLGDDERQRKDLGQFSVGVRVHDTGLAVYVWPDAANCSGRWAGSHVWHPHVGPDGDVCWGTGAELALRHRDNYNVKGLLDLLQVVLQTYTRNDAYVRLNNFSERTSNNSNMRRARDKSPHSRAARRAEVARREQLAEETAQPQQEEMNA